MDRGTNETPGSESKGGRHKLHLEPPYKTNMSSLGPGLRLQRPKACGTSIRQPVVEKIRVVIIPRGQMKNEEKYFSPRVINFFEVGYWQGKTRG